METIYQWLPAKGMQPQRPKGTKKKGGIIIKKRTAWLKFTVIVVVLGIALAGCAAIQKSDTMDTERALAAAGFQMKLADTPGKLVHLETLTQRKLVPHQKDGAVHYVYADATYCKCVYVGTEDAYQRYQGLAIQQKIADEQRVAAEMNEQADMNWGMWGAWGPWW